MKTLICFLLLACSISFGQIELGKELIEPDYPNTEQSLQPGGLYMPSIAENGQIVRVLIVFVQFKDDQWNPTYPEWPKNQAPVGWMNNNFIDQTINQNSTNGNVTDYFSTMSMGHYKVIGDFKHWITSKTRSEYLNAGMQRGLINKEILSEINNEIPGINWANYDNWTKISPNNFAYGPDGEVDMIWMVYRNICEDPPFTAQTAAQLGFGQQVGNVYLKWNGEASLGGGGILPVNNNKTIDLGTFGLVSGTCIMGGYNGFEYVKSVAIHEYGHQLLGGTSEHLTNGTWGMMYAYGKRCQVVNPFERHKLGWINLIQNNYNPLLAFELGDYVTTGQALVVQLYNSPNNPYYLLTNHKRISPLDKIDRTSDGKGVYVLYQPGSSNIDLKFYNSEGRALWTIDHYATHPTVGVQVPVYKRGLNSPSGYFDTDAIGIPGGGVIEAYIDPITGLDVFEPLFAGDGKDMLKPGYVEVFTPWGNPALNGVGFQTILENNVIKINQKIISGTAISLPPTIPQNLSVGPSRNNHPRLTWTANTETDISGYKVYKKTIEEFGWQYLATISSANFEDISETYLEDGGLGYEHDVHYRVLARDDQGLESLPSKSVSATVEGALLEKKGTHELNINKTVTNELEPNFPNPFNPETNIKFSLEEKSSINLTVYNMTGQLVTEIASGVYKRGFYQEKFNGNTLPSGVYILRLTAQSLENRAVNFSKTIKTTLLK